MIFLTATAWLVSWSLAELPVGMIFSFCATATFLPKLVYIPDQAKGAHSDWLQVRISAGDGSTEVSEKGFQASKKHTG